MFSTLGDDGNIDGGMKARRRSHRPLADKFQQTECAQVIEYIRASRPRYLTVLSPA